MTTGADVVIHIPVRLQPWGPQDSVRVWLCFHSLNKLHSDPGPPSAPRALCCHSSALCFMGEMCVRANELITLLFSTYPVLIGWPLRSSLPCRHMLVDHYLYVYTGGRQPTAALALDSHEKNQQNTGINKSSIVNNLSIYYHHTAFILLHDYIWVWIDTSWSLKNIYNFSTKMYVTAFTCNHGKCPKKKCRNKIEN